MIPQLSSGLHIKNAWTAAGVSSFVHVVDDRKRFNILFDCGSIEPGTLQASHVFCSHGHLDHIGACVTHARARALSQGPGNYYVPSNCVEALLTLKRACEALDESEIHMNIFGIEPGQRVQVHPRFFVDAFPTTHRVHSLGYAVFYQEDPQVLPQYRGLDRHYLASLRQETGVQTHTVETNLHLVYTGDTTFAGLLSPATRFIFQAPILIMEMTYLDRSNGRSYAKALEYGHVHIEDVIQNESWFTHVQCLVLVHLSMKYSPAKRGLALLQEHIPSSLRHKTVVCAKALGTTSIYSALDLIDEEPRPGDGWTRSPRTVHNR